MSVVKYLEGLLDGVEVEWLALEEVIVSLKTGLNPRQNFQLNTDDAKGYYVTVREIFDGKVTFFDKTDRVNQRALELINNRSNLEVGDLLFSGTGTVGRTAVVEKAPRNWNIKEGVYVIKPEFSKIHSRYLSHLLNSEEFVKAYSKKIVGAPVISLPMGDLKKIKIPVPCPENSKRSLEIQAEIVRVLDAFTDLSAELSAELTARKKQYNYYRDRLLSFEDGEVEWKPLGEVAKILNGYAFKSSMYCENGIRVIRISDVQKGQMSDANPKYYPTESVDEIRKYLLEEGDLVMSLTGNAGRVAMLSKTDLPAGLNQRVACIRPVSDAVTTRYLFHFLNQDCFENDAMANATGGGQKNMSTTWLASYLIPVPRPKDQSRIVEMLDRFDSLTGSMTEGLPREIELRQKQYEYYRDLLLSFPKPESATA